MILRPRSAGSILAETGWKTLFWLNCCEKKILFQLEKEAEQAKYGVSRTGPKNANQNIGIDKNTGTAKQCNLMQDSSSLHSVIGSSLNL